MTREDLPELRIEVRDTVDVPVFIAGNWWRSTLPARVLGGIARDSLSIQEGWNRPRDLRMNTGGSLIGKDFNRTLLQAVAAGRLVSVFGLSRRLNVFNVKSAHLSGLLLLVRAVRAAGLPAWVEVEEDITAATVDQARVLARRVLGAVPDAWMLTRAVDELKAAFGHVMREASGVVTTTPWLGTIARQFANRVHVIPCGIDLDLFPPTPARPATGPVHVGMTGALLRYEEDLPLVRPGLLAAAREHAARLHFFGGYFPDGAPRERDELVAGRYALDGVPYTYHPAMPTTAFHRAAGILDVAVAPIDPANRMSYGRDAQKWIEFGLHGTAAVLQRHLPPYAPAVEDETCLKAGEAAEWTEQIRRLVTDAPLRRRIGEAAREEVLANHTLEARKPLWEALVAEASGAARVAA